MSHPISIPFCFKGGRDYVQGPDIFNKAIDVMKMELNKSPIVDIDMVFRSITRSSMDMIIVQNAPKISMPSEYNASLFINAAGMQYQLILFENGEKIHCRHPYDEAEITNASIVDVELKTIQLNAFDKYTLIEKIVSLNKKLLNTLFPNHGGKWYFTKIKLKGWDLNFKQDLSIKLVLKKNLQFKLTDTAIFLNDFLVGNIYFSLS